MLFSIDSIKTVRKSPPLEISEIERRAAQSVGLDRFPTDKIRAGLHTKTCVFVPLKVKPNSLLNMPMMVIGGDGAFNITVVGRHTSRSSPWRQSNNRRPPKQNLGRTHSRPKPERYLGNKFPVTCRTGQRHWLRCSPRSSKVPRFNLWSNQYASRHLLRRTDAVEALAEIGGGAVDEIKCSRGVFRGGPQ